VAGEVTVMMLPRSICLEEEETRPREVCRADETLGGPAIERGHKGGPRLVSGVRQGVPGAGAAVGGQVRPEVAHPFGWEEGGGEAVGQQEDCRGGRTAPPAALRAVRWAVRSLEVGGGDRYQ
jgi:hypothetical protein